MGKITINELHKSLFDYVQAVSDDKLETRNKTIVGAINELFSDSVDENIEINNLTNEISNGKELIANAIGEPLTAEDSFNEMSSDINSLLSTFKTNMMNSGITIESGDKFKQLIDKIATMVEEGSGKGIQFVRKDITLPKGSKWLQVNDLGFKANIVMYDSDTSHVLYDDTVGYDRLVLYPNGSSIGSATYSSVSNFPGGMYINENGFRLPIFTAQYTESDTQTTVNKTITIIAIGVGEEDTTLRDSLASILEDEGVSVTEEDDMASLITKVDEEFDNKNITDLSMGTQKLTWTVYSNEWIELSLNHSCGKIPKLVSIGFFDYKTELSNKYHTDENNYAVHKPTGLTNIYHFYISSITNDTIFLKMRYSNFNSGSSSHGVTAHYILVY